MTIATTPDHTALRKYRFSKQGQIYFVTVCCAQRNQLLKNYFAARAAASVLHQQHKQGHAHLIAWVLMPDHMHLMIQLETGKILSQYMNRLNSCTAIAINRALKRHGRVWQGAYHDHALREETDINVCVRYLLNNPLRAGLCEKLEDYPYWDIPNWQGPTLWLD
jgi:putative transposase